MSSQSWPGRFTSSMYSPWPRMNRGSSLRLTEWPMPPISGLVRGVASVVIVVRSRSAGRDGLAVDRGCRDHRGRLALAERAGRLLDRLHDVHVAGAAAEVAADPVTDLVLARVGVLAEQPGSLHEHPRRAEA